MFGSRLILLMTRTERGQRTVFMICNLQDEMAVFHDKPPKMLMCDLLFFRDAEGGGSRRKRPRSLVDPRNFLLLFALLSCLATMVLLYTRVAAT